MHGDLPRIHRSYRYQRCSTRSYRAHKIITATRKRQCLLGGIEPPQIAHWAPNSEEENGRRGGKTEANQLQEDVSDTQGNVGRVHTSNPAKITGPQTVTTYLPTYLPGKCPVRMAASATTVTAAYVGQRAGRIRQNAAKNSVWRIYPFAAREDTRFALQARCPFAEFWEK